MPSRDSSIPTLRYANYPNPRASTEVYSYLYATRLYTNIKSFIYLEHRSTVTPTSIISPGKENALGGNNFELEVLVIV